MEFKRVFYKGVLSRCYLLPKLFFIDVVKSKRKIYSSQYHLNKAIDWIVKAQNMTEDGGVSSSYSLLFGWGASYPETSGYIIPTLFDYYHLTKEKKYVRICKEIADWECSLQLDDGGFQGDVITKSKKTTIFNTGQVILGLVRSYKELKDKRYLDSAIKAGDFLIKVQDKDGNWTTHCFNNLPHTYNVRVAWALLELFLMTNSEKYRECAIKNLNWALKQSNTNHWFYNNAFKKSQNPLLHTISYAIRGFLESGIILDNIEYKKMALNASLKLLEAYEKSSFLPATFDSNWQSTDFYSCLTGDAQLSIIWLKLYQIYKDKTLLLNAIKLNRYLKSTQVLDPRWKDIDGAIKGSDPVWGFYNMFSFPNWATKFFCDALMLELKILSDKN